MDESDRIFLDKLCAGEPPEACARWEDLLARVISLPKAELHCHLAGSMRPETLRDLAASEEDLDWSFCDRGFGFPLAPRIAGADIQGVKNFLEYRKSGGSLSDYMLVYGLPKTVMASRHAIRRVVTEVCEDNFREGVRYLEIRFNPWMLAGTLDITQYITAIAEGLDAAAGRCRGMEVVLLLSLVKDYDAALTERIFREVLEANTLPGVGGRVKGVDSAGNEMGFGITAHKRVFDAARRAGLAVVCHAGEAFRSIEDGIRAIEEAVTLCGARRIGHGLAAGLDPRRRLGTQDLYGRSYDEKRVEEIAGRQRLLRKRLREEDILVEVCPSSNLHTGNLRSLEDHPLGTFLAEGVPVALCTDNRWISHTRLSWEIVRMAKCLDLDYAAVGNLIQAPFRYSLEQLIARRR